MATTLCNNNTYFSTLTPILKPPWHVSTIIQCLDHRFSRLVALRRVPYMDTIPGAITQSIGSNCSTLTAVGKLKCGRVVLVCIQAMRDHIYIERDLPGVAYPIISRLPMHSRGRYAWCWYSNHYPTPNEYAMDPVREYCDEKVPTWSPMARSKVPSGNSWHWNNSCRSKRQHPQRANKKHVLALASIPLPHACVSTHGARPVGYIHIEGS